MFGFLFAKKRNEVLRFMQRRMNRSRVCSVSPGQRGLDRDAFCQVVWIIPTDGHSEPPDYRAAFPVVTRDISPHGLSFIHTGPIHSRSVIVGLDEERDTGFVRCSVQHCTPLGYGFYQIGVHIDEIIHPDRTDAEHFQRRAEQFDVRAKTRSIAALASSPG